MRKRIEKETEGLFEAIFPVSLLEALESTKENGKWASSGVAEFSDYLVHLLMNSTAPEKTEPIAGTSADGTAGSAQAAPEAIDENRVTPRRVSASPAQSATTTRLDRGTAGAGF